MGDEANLLTLPSPPFDSISQLKFSPTSPDHLLVASWDTHTRLYEVGEKGGRESEVKAKFDHRAAVLTCCFSDGSHGYSGGLDTAVRELDLTTESVKVLGNHSGPVSTITWSKESGTLVTGSWDRTVRLWDPRSSTSQQSTHSTPERIYQLDIVNNTLVVAMASRLFHIYDIRNMEKPAQERESSLKYMTRSLACMPSGEGYATASVEGRIAVEYFEPTPEAQEKKYAFKCHRQTINDVDHVWPVNALAFHPTYNTFASGGSDGTVSIWDHKVKKRLRQYPKLNNALASLAFNCDGAKLAIALSYMWDDGDAGLKTAERPSIVVRKLGDEVKPKAWPGN